MQDEDMQEHYRNEVRDRGYILAGVFVVVQPCRTTVLVRDYFVVPEIANPLNAFYVTIIVPEEFFEPQLQDEVTVFMCEGLKFGMNLLLNAILGNIGDWEAITSKCNGMWCEMHFGRMLLTNCFVE